MPAVCKLAFQATIRPVRRRALWKSVERLLRVMGLASLGWQLGQRVGWLLVSKIPMLKMRKLTCCESGTGTKSSGSTAKGAGTASSASKATAVKLVPILRSAGIVHGLFMMFLGK